LAAFTAFATRLRALFGGLDNILTYEVLNEPLSECLSAGAYASLAAAFRNGFGNAISGIRTPTLSVMPAGDWLNSMPVLGNVFHPELDANADSIRERSCLAGALQTRFPRAWLVTPHFYDPRPIARRIPSANEGRVQRAGAYHALLRPFVRKCGGPMLDATWNPTDGTYRVRIGRAYRAGWRTEIYVPASLQGYRSTGTSDSAGRTLIVDTDDGEREVTVELWADD
jgi:hypothetical protein